MGLKDTINNLIETYGVNAVIRRYQVTTNDYGEEQTSGYTEENVKVIVDSYIITSFARQLFGYFKDTNMTLIVASDVVVGKNDTVVLNNDEWTVDSVKEIVYKGETVAKQIVLV